MAGWWWWYISLIPARGMQRISVSPRSVWFTQLVSGQSGLQNETLSQKKKRRKENNNMITDINGLHLQETITFAPKDGLQTNRKRFQVAIFLKPLELPGSNRPCIWPSLFMFHFTMFLARSQNCFQRLSKSNKNCCKKIDLQLYFLG